MKKKYIAIIAISSVTLLLGSSIYCGICAYPELLKNSDEENVVTLNNEIEQEETNIFSYENYDEPSQAIVIESGSVSSNVFADNSLTSSRPSKKTIFDDLFFEIVPTIEESVKNDIISSDSVEICENYDHESSYIFYEHDEANDVSNSYKKLNTRKNIFHLINNYEKTSHQAVLETSLIVIAFVDILSLLLVNRKKFKGYHF